MSSFIINGGKRLRGEIIVGGSKNAVLPIIFASIMTEGVSVLRGAPDISDVRVALGILEDLGAVAWRVGDKLYIDTTSLRYTPPRECLVSQIRASAYLLGACLARFGEAELAPFGGCAFEHRPIDMHLQAISLLGAEQIGSRFLAKKLHGATIIHKTVSVGATVNAILLATAANGTTRIFGYAKEPHVILLIDYLRLAGADISVFDDYLLIEGGAPLVGAEITVIPDMIEAGTFLALSLATDSELKIVGASQGELKSFLAVLERGGVTVVCDDDSVTARGKPTSPLEVITAPYPEFPTDLQPQTAALMSATSGGKITEGVWRSRFGYLNELEKFGVRFSRDGATATVYPSRLHSARAVATDLRGGAAELILALLTSGESVINEAQIINRGYESIIKKLRAVGAEIYEI